MSIPKIAPTVEPIASTQPTGAQRIKIAGTRIQIGSRVIQGFFSSLQEDDKLMIIGDENTGYNCISWSHGVTDQWNNPPLNPKAYYQNLGFKLCTQGDQDKKIAVWFDDHGNTTHAACRKRVNINGSIVLCWTSKLGQSYCISHSIDRLNGNPYGTPAMFFK